MEAPQGVESRSTNMSSFLCGILYGTVFLFACISHHECGKPNLRIRRPGIRLRMPGTKCVHGVGGLARGLYPISFRTRQSSLFAAMVLAVTGGESS